MDPVVHFEMPAEDRKRMADFYTNVFGWKTQLLDDTMQNYVIVTTTETDANGRPQRPGAINGGFYPTKEGGPAQHPSIVISVKDIQASIKKVITSGGNVLGKPVAIPGIGQYVSFTDTEGNRVSILEPSSHT